MPGHARELALWHQFLLPPGWLLEVAVSAVFKRLRCKRAVWSCDLVYWVCYGLILKMFVSLENYPTKDSVVACYVSRLRGNKVR